MTLTDARKTFQMTLKFGWLVIFLPLFVRIMLAILIPEPPPPPPDLPQYDALFGKIPALEIDNFEILPSTPQFQLDLVTAGFVETPPLVRVYPIISAPYGFLSRDQARALARNLFFTTEPEVVEETRLVWRDTDRTLNMNASNLNFRYNFDYTSNLSIFRIGAFGSEEFAMNIANDVMHRLEILGGLRGPDLRDGERTIQKLRYDGTGLAKATTLSQTTAMRVDYFRTPFNEVAVVSPNFYESLVNITISPTNNQPRLNFYPQIVELNYTYWEINRTRSATYPVIPAEVAYARMQEQFMDRLVFLGNSQDPSETYPSNQVRTVTTRNVYLGYYDTALYQQYLQPVWVFTGVARIETGRQVDFVAYIPALADEWIE